MKLISSARRGRYVEQEVNFKNIINKIMITEEELTFNNVHYKVKFDKASGYLEFNLKNNSHNDNSRPEYLYKYYSLTKNSVDALLKGYFYASHPDQLNDKYDCAADLFDCSNCDLDFFIQELSNYRRIAITKEEIIQCYYSQDRWKLGVIFSICEQDRLFRIYGVISLAQEEDNMLLWANYSQNSGFAIKMKTDSLIKDKWFGPFPINYTLSMGKIDYSKYSSVLHFLYLTNVKYNIWSEEKEWRYIFCNLKGCFHPYYNKRDIQSRYAYYNKNALSEIILGYEFYNPTTFKDYRSNSKILKLKHKHADYKLKRSLLNFIVSSNLDVSIMVKDSTSYKLEKRPLSIEKAGTNTFILTYKD
jgi:hypothetical protein